jgi:Cu2+-containing amine oxidase
LKEVSRIAGETSRSTNMGVYSCIFRACHNAPAHLNSRRLMQGFLYGRLCPGDNEYAHPIDMCPIVDLNEERVVHIDMPEGKSPPVSTNPYYLVDMVGLLLCLLFQSSLIW